MTSLSVLFNISSHVTAISSTRPHALAIFQVFTNFAIFIILARACTRISCIIFLACTMFYWLFTLTQKLNVVLFLPWVKFLTIKFKSTLTWNIFCECLWFIYLFDNIKYFQACASHFIRKKCSTKFILASVKTTITLVRTSDESMVLNFIRIQINKRSSNHTLYIIIK